MKFLLFAIATFPIAILAEEMSNPTASSNGFRTEAQVVLVNPGQPEQHRQRLVRTDKVLADGTTDTLNQSVSRFATKALLVASKNSIIYEKYGTGVDSKSTPLGYSISKSLTGLAVGKAMCRGDLRLDDPASMYLPKLGATSWGKATVKQLLQMQSGAFKTELSGHKNSQMQRYLGNSISNGTMRDSFVDLMLKNDDRTLPAGKRFYYNNLDTVALGLLVENATKTPFATFFEKYLWEPSGAENAGAWLVNSNNEVSNYNGFSATARDWLQFGAYVLAELKEGDECFKNFLKEATSTQVNSMGSSSTYGYQIWTECERGIDFCFTGYGGQYLLFNVAKDIVIYHHARSAPRNSRFFFMAMSDVIKSID